MNKQKFIEYLRKPVDLSEQNLEELEQLIGEHPYFQSARTLLAKGSKMNQSKKASLHINSAAVYATDRVLLKRYINDELIFLSPLPVHESHEADHERDLAQVIKTNRQTTSRQKISKAHQIKSESAEGPPQKQVEKKPTKAPASAETVVPDKPSNLDHIIEELYRDMEELKINRAKFREIENKLEEDEAVDEAVKKATEKASTKKDQKKPDPTDKTESVEKPAESPEKPLASKSARKASLKPEREIKKPASKKTASEKSSASAKKRELSKKTEKRDTPAEKDSEGKKDKEDPDLSESRKTKQETIISEFIKKNPSISPADGKKKTDEDLSGDSTVLHPDLASEYLAEIYLEQGKKEMAKKIYENLIVKFPEKSVYFAKIIKKLN